MLSQFQDQPHRAIVWIIGVQVHIQTCLHITHTSPSMAGNGHAQVKLIDT